MALTPHEAHEAQRIADLAAGSRARAQARRRTLEVILAHYAAEHGRCPTCLERIDTLTAQHEPGTCDPPPPHEVLGILGIT